MTLFYLACELVYFLTVCLYEQIALQTQAVLIAMGAQVVYSLLVWTRKSAPATHLAKSTWLAVFALMIMALAIYLGDFVFRENSAWLFLVSLILVTQIYSMPPKEMFTALPLYEAAFLLFSFLNKSGQFFFIDAVSSLCALGVALISYVTILGYKVEQSENRKELTRMCAMDAMTGMLNKNTFIYVFNEYLRTFQNKPAHYALAVMDIDHFKAVNDEYGHLMGDAVLQDLAAHLNARFPDAAAALPGRFGGDEFVLLLKGGSDPELIRSMLEGELSAYSDSIAQKLGIPITFSAGVALETRTDLGFSELFVHADRELYSAKAISGNSVCVAGFQSRSDAAPIVICARVPEADRKVLDETLGQTYRLIDVDSTVMTIGTFERYGESMALAVVGVGRDPAWDVIVHRELNRLSAISAFGVILLTGGAPLSGPWKDDASAQVFSHLDAESLTACVNRHGDWC
jgi:diguanylate cyclase (GGDEF)-like protein